MVVFSLYRVGTGVLCVRGCAGFGFAELCQPDLGSPDPPSCPQEPAVPGWGR